MPSEAEIIGKARLAARRQRELELKEQAERERLAQRQRDAEIYTKTYQSELANLRNPGPDDPEEPLETSTPKFIRLLTEAELEHYQHFLSPESLAKSVAIMRNLDRLIAERDRPPTSDTPQPEPQQKPDTPAARFAYAMQHGVPGLEQSEVDS